MPSNAISVGRTQRPTEGHKTGSSDAIPTTRFDTAIVVGRWQLPHVGHGCLFVKGLAIADRLIVVVGSAFRSRDTRQPFNAQERQEMILAAIAPEDRCRVNFLPVRDYYNDERWNKAVQAGVEHLLSRTEKVALVGFKKDDTSYYLDNFPGWVSVPVEPLIDIDATSLRNAFFGETDMAAKLAVLRPYVSPGVIEYLQTWANLPAYALLVKEQTAVVAYRKRWPAPWYMTADALVRVGDYVLLVQRGGEIGYGLWALPGGFVNPNEMFFPAALRELKEETGFSKLLSTMKAALKSSATFEHPLRSPRGRIATNTYYFAFAEGPLPEVIASDDAMAVKWVHIYNELPSYIGRLFEDHDVQLDHFVGLYPAEID